MYQDPMFAVNAGRAGWIRSGPASYQARADVRLIRAALDGPSGAPGPSASAQVSWEHLLQQLAPPEGQMRIGSVFLIIWLIIGVIACGQRGYFDGSLGSCTRVGTIAVTILAGPLNYVGVNPKITCTVPQPSK
jgi:hypothetical protein